MAANITVMMAMIFFVSLFDVSAPHGKNFNFNFLAIKYYLPP